MPAAPEPQAPQTQGIFSVEIDNDALASPMFYATEVAGLAADTEVYEFREGGMNDMSHKLPGPMRYKNVTAKRGIVSSDTEGDMLRWLTDMGRHEEGAQKKRANVRITLYTGPEMTPLMAWTLVNAWPVHWECGPFEGQGEGLLVKQVEFAYERLQVEEP